MSQPEFPDSTVGPRVRERIARCGFAGSWTRLGDRLLRVRAEGGRYVASVWPMPKPHSFWPWQGQSLLGSFETIAEASRAAALALSIGNTPAVCTPDDVDDARARRWKAGQYA